MARRTSLIIGGTVAALALSLSACGGGDGGDEANPSLPAEFTVTTRGPLPAFSDEEVAKACAALEPILEVGAASDAATAGLADAFADPEVLADPDQVGELYAELDEVMAVAEADLTFYNDAVGELPGELGDEVIVLRNARAAIVPLLSDIVEARPPGGELIAQLQEALTDPELAILAGEALDSALWLDQFTDPNCGFLISATG